VPKSVVAGGSILVAAQLLYFLVLMKVTHHELLRVLLFVAPGLASLVAAYFSPTQKMIVGLSMALLGSILGVLFSYAYEALGFPIDHIGGFFVTASILVLYYIGPSIVGSVVGKLISERRSRQVPKTL